MTVVKISESSSFKTEWRKWVITPTGKYHLAKDRANFTACGKKVERWWDKRTRLYSWPGSLSDPLAERKAALCKRCAARVASTR